MFGWGCYFLQGGGAGAGPALLDAEALPERFELGLAGVAGTASTEDMDALRVI